MITTLFADYAARTAKATDMTLEQIRDFAKSITAPTKSALPWLKLCRFGDNPTQSGALHHNANVLAITGIEGDYDNEVISPEEAAATLSAAGVEALIYTSPSHTPMLPRWRVLCPLSQEHPPAMRAELAGRLNHVLGGESSTESFTLSQAFYIGGTATGSPVETYLTAGRAIGTLELPTRYPAKARTETLRLPVSVPGQSADERTKAIMNAALDAFDVLLQSRHDTILATTLAFSGHLDRFDVINRVTDACTASGREPNHGEVAEALDGALSRVQPYIPATGEEFDPLPSLPAPARAGLLGRLIFPADCGTLPGRGYLIKHLLAPGDVAALIGPPSAGKSVLAPHIAYAVAQGRIIFGLRTPPGRVLYAVAEDGAGMRLRVRALYNQHGDAPDFALVEINNLRDRSGAAELEAAVAEWKPALLVIDTLGAAWAGLEENSSEAMGDVVAFARRIAASGCALLITHHIAKAGGGSPRGHSALNGTLDMCLALGDRAADGTIRAKLQKNRNGTPDREIAFCITVAELGQDEDGDAITTVIAAEVTADRPSAPKLNRQQTIAWGEFLKLEAETAPDVSGTRAVSLTMGKEKCGLAALSASSSQDSQRTEFNRAAGELYRLNYIMKLAVYAWRPAHGVRYETSETDRDGSKAVTGHQRDRRDGGYRDPRPVSVPGSESVDELFNNERNINGTRHA